MIKSESLLVDIVNAVDEGIIFIDKNNVIKLMNDNAKEFLGIILNKVNSHPSGQIESGDIVIIVDNILGDDDGNLSSEDLKLINIENEDIKRGDALIAVGVYNNSDIKPLYKYWRKTTAPINYALDTEFCGFKIKGSIDVSDKKLKISVNEFKHTINYMHSVGHMVIVDGKSGLIKFFQDKGYTIRKENINDVLHGNKYLSKGLSEHYEVIGKNINEILEYSEVYEKINKILHGDKMILSNEYYELNKRPTLCTFIPVSENDEISGLIIKIRDISQLENLLKDRNEILDNIEKVEEILRRKSIYTENKEFDSVIGNSSAMDEIKYLVEKASKIKSNVLISGESGTGKTMLARIIHDLDDKSKPFIHVNCSAIPPNLFESELFGYVKGAFTGATSKGKIGYFEMADGGTLFLDEIGEIPGSIQVKLLHALQTKSFYRIGSETPVNVNVRIITATNKNLEEEVENGNFREDLFYRINVFPIVMPPLRERKRDIYPLINSILDNLAETFQVEPKQLSASALNAIIEYNWPGNIRELENIIERAFCLCETKIIQPEYINIKKTVVSSDFSLKNVVMEAEKKAIEQALRMSDNNKVDAIKILGISKSTFYEKLNKYFLI